MSEFVDGLNIVLSRNICRNAYRDQVEPEHYELKPIRVVEQALDAEIEQNFDKFLDSMGTKNGSNLAELL